MKPSQVQKRSRYHCDQWTEVPLPVYPTPGSVSEEDAKQIGCAMIGNLRVLGYGGTSSNGGVWVVRCGYCHRYSYQRAKRITQAVNGSGTLSCSKCASLDSAKRSRLVSANFVVVHTIPANLREYARKGCFGKKKYGTPATAELRCRELISSPRWTGEPVTAYNCPICQWWHVGRKYKMSSKINQRTEAEASEP